MPDIKTYYCGIFQRDLDAVFGIHRPYYFGSTWRTYGCPELRIMAQQRRPAFLCCLYFTVLFDQGLYHHAHHAYKKSGLPECQPKFCPAPGKGHMNPRGILRWPMHWGLVSAESLMELTTPAADLLVALCAQMVRDSLPEVCWSDFSYLVTGFPEVSYWSPRVISRFPAETKVEQEFLTKMLNAIKRAH